MPMDDTAEQGPLMDADAGASRVVIGVTLDLRPLSYHIELTRVAVTVLIAISRHDHCIARVYCIVYHRVYPRWTAFASGVLQAFGAH
jgi:hypothetical protein